MLIDWVIEGHSFGRRDGVPDTGRLEQVRLRSIARPPGITKDKMLVGELVENKASCIEGENLRIFKVENAQTHFHYGRIPKT